MTEGQTTWKFPRTFWFANTMELFERAAYYGCFIFLTVFLTKRVGFTDIETGTITGAFSFFLYFMPTFMGLLSDKIGFKKAVCLAFLLLSIGYAILGAFPSKVTAIVALTIVMLGGAIVKPVISGTVAQCSDAVNRARAFSLFYWAVNIGSFTGKSVVDPIRSAFLANEGTGFFAYLRVLMGGPTAEGSELQFVNLYSSLMALIGFFVALFFYKNVITAEPDKKAQEDKLKKTLEGLKKVLTNFRFLSLIMIVGLFWSIQGQLYATMPKYLFRMVGEFTKPGWVANVNPAIVVLFVIPITQMVRKWRPINSIAISFLIIPLSAFTVTLASNFGPGDVSLGFISLHPIVLTMIIGIMFQGLAECFLSPKYLEFASKQAPEGEVGLYMGYSHLHSAFGWLFGFALSGKLLDMWCPDPAKLPAGISAAEKATYYAHAHWIWYVYTGVGIIGLGLLFIFRYVTDRIDKKKALQA